MEIHPQNEANIPIVSVIVPVYNDSLRIANCIEALLNQTYPKEKYEIIIIDNGSTDNTKEIIRRYPVRLLIETHIQSSYGARNKGIRNAVGDVIAFTDSDCIPHFEWIEKGVFNLMNTANCGLVGGKIEIFFKNPGKPNAVELYDSIMGFNQKEDIDKHHFGSTANVFTFKKIIDEVGMFNDSLKSGGDNEWGRRVYSFGYELIYADDTCVAHPARFSYSDLYNRVARLAGGNYDQRSSNMDIIKYWMKSIRYSITLILRIVLRMHPSERMKGLQQNISFIWICIYVEFVRNIERIKLLTVGNAKR